MRGSFAELELLADGELSADAVADEAAVVVAYADDALPARCPRRLIGDLGEGVGLALHFREWRHVASPVAAEGCHQAPVPLWRRVAGDGDVPRLHAVVVEVQDVAVSEGLVVERRGQERVAERLSVVLPSGVVQVVVVVVASCVSVWSILIAMSLPRSMGCPGVKSSEPFTIWFCMIFSANVRAIFFS